MASTFDAHPTHSDVSMLHIEKLRGFDFHWKITLWVMSECVWACGTLYCTSSFFLPVIVSVAERSDGNGEGLPHRVQRVLHHFSLVADGEPGDTGRVQGFKILKDTPLKKKSSHHALLSRPCLHEFVFIPPSSRDLNLIPLTLVCFLFDVHALLPVFDKLI